MKCTSCALPMVARVDDVDYTKLAGLRDTTVTLCEITVFRCKRCGPAADYIEVPRMAELHRNLAAAKALHSKKLWFRIADGEWALVIRSKSDQVRGVHNE